jgi:hypothetical protein
LLTQLIDAAQLRARLGARITSAEGAEATN